MRSEIRRLCKQVGLTTIYVTHDQKEALSKAVASGVFILTGAPGFRKVSTAVYYGAFIYDLDGNKVEAVTFPKD